MNKKGVLLANPFTVLSLDEEAHRRTAYAKQFEEIQDFASAFESLEVFWPDTASDPTTEGLSVFWTAEVFLRAGALLGWRGEQERAKNYLTHAFGIFQSIDDRNKAAECFIELGICYVRDGAFDEARDILREAQQHIEDDDLLKARVLYTLALNEKSAKQLKDALRYYAEAEPVFKTLKHYALKCKFCSGYANLLVQVGRSDARPELFDKAIELYTASSIFAERADNLRHQGIVENNLAYLYYTLKMYVEAHDHLDTARKISRKLKDHSLVAQIDETRARVLTAQKRYDEAEQTVTNSIKHFEKSGELSLLAEALVCRGTARARGQKYEAAETDFTSAVETAKRVEDKNGAASAVLTLLEEIPCLTVRKQIPLYQEANNLLASTQDTSLLSRLRGCATRLIHGLSDMNFDQHEGDGKLIHLEPHKRAKLWSNLTLEKAKHELEEWLIEKMLRETGGNVSEAARRLGITPSGLHDKLDNEYQHLSFLKRTTHKDAANTPVAERKKDAPLVLRMTCEALNRRGVKTGDRLVAVDEDIREGDPVAAWRDGKVYVGYYSEYFLNGIRRIKLDVDTPGLYGWDFVRESVEKLRLIVGVVKATDLNKKNPPVLPI